ncbi:MAG: hypothetical protein R2688_00165 [Fimbriimonadaceae bacterium]
MIRKVIGHARIVTPGIRANRGETNDQNRIGDGKMLWMRARTTW